MREPSPGDIRILLVDDMPLFRHAIATLIADQPHLTVVGEAENGLHALEMARALRPDLAMAEPSANETK